jgi:putative photosynthetic complex assembly protein
MMGGGHIDMGPTTAVESLLLNFKDLPNGGVLVTNAETGKLVANVLPTTGGFLRGIMRALVRDHDLAQKPAGTSFRLTQWADGRLSIEDPATRESFELEAFGHTNEAVFASLFNHPMAKFSDMGVREPD